MDADRALDVLMKNADEAEIFFEGEVSSTLKIKGETVDVFTTHSSGGYGVRLIKEKKTGFAFSNRLDASLLERALSAAKLGEVDEFISLPCRQKYNTKSTFDRRIPELDAEDAIEFAKTLTSPCEKYKAVPTTGAISWSHSSVKIWNSNGMEASDRNTMCSCVLNTKAGDAVSGFYYDVSGNIDLDFARVGEEASRLAAESVNAREIEPFTGCVILKPYAVAELLEHVLVPSFSADNIQRKRSYLAGKVGERVFSNALDITDDGTLKRGLCTSKFDAEGVRSQKTSLVKGGVLKGYLYNTYTAKKGNVESTGSAERSSYTSVPGTGPSNFIISGKGKMDGGGLLVNGLIGAHTANPVSGDFSVETRNAFLNGTPVKKAIISGNVFTLLNQIVGFGKDVEQVSAVRAPAIEFSGVNVIG